MNKDKALALIVWLVFFGGIFVGYAIWGN